MKKCLAVIMIALAVLLGIELGMERMFTMRIQETAPAMADTSEPAAQEPVEKPEIYAIFGVDTDEGDTGRSDCTLLVSFEQESGTVRMCSIARDTMVTIPGEGIQTKLGHAYFMGGAEKAMETLNENFGLEISHYTSVNFSQMAELVDLMGGVELPLTRAEWNYMGFNSPYLGTKHLTGAEALKYCRIRSIDSDDVRTGRQRMLIAAMLENLREVPRGKLPSMLSEGIKMCQTNIGFADILRLGKDVLSVQGGIQTVSMALPGDSVSAWGGIRDDGIWYYVYDLDRASQVVSEFFYGEPAQDEDTQNVLGDV